MENLALNLDYDAYAVIDKHDKVIDIMENFNDAIKIARDYNAPCIEALTDYDGHTGIVADTFWVNDVENSNMIRQKIYALIMIILSAITIPILDGDATFALFMIPCMIYMLLTKKYWLID